MTQCNATAELVDANMQVIPGITLRCDYEFGHPDSHSCPLRWDDPTADELAEVLDPDESFDLEVDIADEAVLEQQQNNAIDNGVPMLGSERDYARIPDAAPRCSTCGREVGQVGPGWMHTQPMAWRHAVTLD